MNNEDITKAVAKLQAAAEKNAKVTQALRSAAMRVAELIEDSTPEGVRLPGGYRVVTLRSNLGQERYLARGEELIDSTAKGYPLHGDLMVTVPRTKASEVMQFARDIDNGLLDTIADAVEKWNREAEEATRILTSHAAE